jgi:hypothetical protein
VASPFEGFDALLFEVFDATLFERLEKVPCEDCARKMKEMVQCVMI